MSSSPLALDSQAIANVLGSDATTSEFFQEELNLLPRPRHYDLSSTTSTSTFRSTRSRIASSLYRTFTGASADSVGLTERKTFTLEQLCGFIYIHPSLQSAGIISCSCYTEPTRARFIPHRFLILQLSRKGRQNVWLRLDRRPSNILGLAVGFGVTPANDTAMLASSCAGLLTESPNAVEESQLAFESPSLLSNLRSRLLDITAVLDRYKLASENCWAFCALLLSYFNSLDNVAFTIGELHHPKLARKAKRRIFGHHWAHILSPHDPSLYMSFSVLLGYLIFGAARKVVEAAHRWEDSDGFNSSDGQLLAGDLISALSQASWIIHQDPDSQLALQTTALCRQVAACAGASWATLGSDVCTHSIILLRQHGYSYLESKSPNPNAALPLLEEATLLLVRGVTRNYDVCGLHYYHAIPLHVLGRLDEARVVVMDFIECVRHQGGWLGNWHDEMRELRSRGIWPSEFNYLLDLEQGDLPYWLYWRKDQFKSQASLPSQPPKSTPSSLPTSFPSGTLVASAVNGEDSVSNVGDVGEVHSRSQVRDAESADGLRFDIEVV